MAKNKKPKEPEAGRLSIEDLMSVVNKSAGREVAYDLTDENPTDVKGWIPTGSRWLDSIVCKGKRAGIPIGKISELASLSGVGKSYMAAQIAANAQKDNIFVVYFDSESAIDSKFLAKSGCDLKRLLYIQASSVEFVLEQIEALLAKSNKDKRILFIWDSLAFTPSISDIEGDFNPQSSMAIKPRILAKGLSKITQPIANKQATLLILNQLKTNIQTGIGARTAMMVSPYMTPGGKALIYSYSLRIWLTGRKSKASYIEDENGYRVGSEVKARIEKSRFGSQGRTCSFKILWGTEDAGIQCDESMFEALRGRTPHLVSAGSWYTMDMGDGTSVKFQPSKWKAKMKDDKFRERVYELIDEVVVQKFLNREGSAKEFYEEGEK